MMKYKVCIDKPFPNCERIYPIQQKKVLKIIEHLSSNSNVKKIIIFGSSISSSCHVGSDVDLYIEIKKEENVMTRAFDFVYDSWTNYTVDNRMLNEINQKGVIVYEK